MSSPSLHTLYFPRGQRRETWRGHTAGKLVLLAYCLLLATACSTTGGSAWYEQRIEAEEALDVPFVRQSAQADCGIAALVSVMQYYDDSSYSPQALLDRYPAISPKGYSLGELRSIAQAQGFTTFIVPGDKAFLRSQLARNRPVIVPLQMRGATPAAPTIASHAAKLIEPLANRLFDRSYDHYVVIVGILDERHQIVVMDPARGPVGLDFDDFAAGWKAMHHAMLLVGLTAEAE